MKILAFALLLAAAPFAIAAPVPKELKKEEKLDGVWELISLESFGQTRVPPKQRWKFEGEKIVVEQGIPNGAARVRPPVTIKVDAGALPKSLDYNAGGERNMRPAIYEVDGDTLRILLNARSTDRPKLMKSDEAFVMYVFKRVQE